MLALVATLSLGLGAATHVALYPLQPLGASRLAADEMSALDAALRAEIGDLKSYQLSGAGQTQALIVPPGGLGLNCDDGKPDCLASLGRMLGASVVVFGKAGADAAELSFTDVKGAQEVRRVRIAVRPEGTPGSAVREACVALLAPDRYTGTIEVTGEHGKLAVDNADRGDLPLNGPVSLPAGRHRITITLPGRASWNAAVDILWRQCAHVDGARAPLEPPGSAPHVVYTAQAAQEIPESHPAPHPERSMSLGRQLSYATFAGAVVGGALGIVFGAISADNTQALQAQTRPIPFAQAATAAQQASRGSDFGTVADVVWGISAAAAITGVVLYLVSPEYEPERPFEGRVEVSGAGALVRF